MSQDFAKVQDILNTEFREPLADLINRSNPVLRALRKRAVSSQRIFLKAALSSDHAAGPVADGSDITFSGTESTTYINPTLDWATYKAQFSIPKRVIAQVASNPGQIGNILRSEIEMATKDMTDKIAADIFAGDTTNGLVGVQSIVADDNTYAGIDRSAAGNENWQAAVLDHQNAGSTQELSTGVLYQLDEEFFALNGYGFSERPGLFTGVTGRQIMTKYKGLLETIDLGSLSSAHFVNQANNTGQLGFASVGFLGVPFIRDRNVSNGGSDLADSGRLYFLDMNEIELAILTPGPDSMIHQVQGFQAAPPADGIAPQIEILGNKGESVQGYVKTYIQLATSAPKRAGALIKNIAAV